MQILTILNKIDIKTQFFNIIEYRTMVKIINRDRFDFEIGYLTKSPCLTCEQKSDLPKCHKECLIIDKIQTTLARGISSQSSSYES